MKSKAGLFPSNSGAIQNGTRAESQLLHPDYLAIASWPYPIRDFGLLVFWKLPER